MIDEHCEAIVADLSRYHGRRLVDLRTGALTFLELGALLAKLPPESALHTEQRDRLTDEELADAADSGDVPYGSWSRGDMLLAAVFDALMQLIHVQIRRAGADVEPPEPLRRPGVVARKRPLNPQAIAYLQRIRDLHAQQQAEEVNGT